METSTIDLSEFYLLDIYGIGKVSLIGEFDSDKLSQKMIDSWVSFGECHRHCSRSDYCKYVIWIDDTKTISKEIECGVVKFSLINFVNQTFKTFQELNSTQKQNYLNGAYHFSQFIFKSEITIGNYTNEYFLNSWDHYASTAYGHAKYIRKHIEMMAFFFKDIPEFHIRKEILFVEGESEFAFLNKLKESHLIGFIDLEIFNYKGKSNKKPTRIEMLLKDYSARGYNLYIQGDADGKSKNTFQTLIDKNLIHKANTFIFNYDFETSIPASLMFATLKNLNLIDSIEKSDFIDNVSKTTDKVENILKNIYGVDISSHKVKIAEETARNINETIECWKSEWFLNTELGKFLKFIQNIN